MGLAYIVHICLSVKSQLLVCTQVQTPLLKVSQSIWIILILKTKLCRNLKPKFKISTITHLTFHILQSDLDSQFP